MGIASKRAHVPSLHSSHLLRATLPFFLFAPRNSINQTGYRNCACRNLPFARPNVGGTMVALSQERETAYLVRTEWPYYRLRDGGFAENGDIFIAPPNSLKFQLCDGHAEQVAFVRQIIDAHSKLQASSPIPANTTVAVSLSAPPMAAMSPASATPIHSPLRSLMFPSPLLGMLHSFTR